MTGTITDPDVQRLADEAASLEGDYPPPTTDPWEGSPFAWIKPQPPATKGAIAEKLVARYCQAHGLNVAARPDGQSDRIIEGRRIEIKFSMLGKKGRYIFQQFRDQNYEYAVCLGISPFDVHCWVIPKDIIMENAKGQHGGRSGTDTKWFSFRPDSPLDWLASYGGSLSAALVLLRQL